MNKGVFRLVFSKRLGMVVPASEMTRSRSCKSRPGRLRRRLAAILAAATTAYAPHAFPAQPAGLIPHATKGWTPNVSIDVARTNATQMTIKQTSAKAILNWQQLNLNRGESLIFDQQGNRSWSALNRIYDANPSIIAGRIQADGHIYLINSNGIIFGDGAQINVGSLTAGSLDVTDELYNSGILSNASAPVFSGTGGFVRVEEGAAITAATGGRVMLLAPDVENSGVINTPEGQTILAAGKSVYLLESEDTAGLLVEVNSGGTATNLGDIIAQRGNVTLVGLAVNQQGRISATTSVRANGSIRLLARDTVQTTGTALNAQRGGVVTLGKDSVTEIAVETGDKEEVYGTQEVAKSRLELSGRVIDIDGSILAQGGDVSAIAAFNPSVVTVGSAVDPTRVYLGEHALIDVSGVDALAPMSRNQLEIQLYSEQLKDTPLLRGTDWVGKTIYVDKRKGTDLISDDALLAAENQQGATIAERMSKAGTVTLNAALGDVVMQTGSKVDVSGGSITYEAGYIKESELLYKGQKIAVSDANRNTPYEGLADEYTQNYEKWGQSRTWSLNGSRGRYNAAYTDGSNAGTFSVSAINSVLQGQLDATTRTGTQQRESVPQGGTFKFELLPSASLPSFRIVDRVTNQLGSSFTAVGAFDADEEKFGQGSTLSNSEIQLDNDLFAHGFTTFDLSTGSGGITVDAAIQAAPGSTITMNTAQNIAVNADIIAAGGAVKLTGGAIAVADNVTISASGLYTNDLPDMPGAGTAPIAQDGGSVSLLMQTGSLNGLTLGEGVKVEADAGAWLKSNGKLAGGDGGSVTLEGVGSLDGATVTAYGFGEGGSLTLETDGNIQAGGQDTSSAGTLWLAESFFGQGGFSDYTLKTSLNASSILIGDAADHATQVKPVTQTLTLNNDARVQASGADIMSVANARLPAAHLRKAGSLTFESAGTLTLAENATIRTDAPGVGAGGAVSLKSFGQMTLLGDVETPSGTISAAVTRKPGNYEYDKTLSLYVGESSRLSATGSVVTTPSSDGLLHAKVMDAGSINLDGGAVAAVVLKQGSMLDVSGVSGTADITAGNETQRETLHGDAGNIAVTTRNGMALDGDMRASATGTGADGSLTLKFAVADGGIVPGMGDPEGARALTVTQQKQLLVDGLNAGDAVDGVRQESRISAEQVAAAGFGSLNLDVDRGITGDKVVLAGGLDMQLQDALTVRTGLLDVASNGDAKVGAKYVALGTDGEAAAPVAGNGTLAVEAEYIDMIGNMAVSGVKSTTLTAEKDIRVRGKAEQVLGSFIAPGAMTLTARQIYPVSNSKYALKATGAESMITIGQSAASSTSVLSAGGELTLEASDIVQGGTLLAPMGTLNLKAEDSLTIASGSRTSVSADGMLIPFGLTALGGLAWHNPTSSSIDASTNTDGKTQLPEKKINLDADKVDMQDGAVVDISGGGDLLAYEWIEGIGGSSDILGQSGVYAVLPGYSDGFAPFDYNYQLVRGSDPIRTDIKVGDSIYLSGGNGLEANTYTLLPARYALLPGAFMVQVADGNLASGTSVAQVDGSALVNGHRLNGGARDALDSVYKVTSGGIFHTAKGAVSKAPSEYRLSTANAFFTDLAEDAGTDVPRLVADAGQLIINADSRLALNADIAVARDESARGALVDIVSDKISVVSVVGAENGTLQLAAESLNTIDAESLLLGGSRTKTSNGYSIVTSASSVSIENDDDHTLAVTELIAVAKDAVAVKSGADVVTKASDRPVGESQLQTQGNGAMLAVSSVNDLELTRTGATNSAGTLLVEEHANVYAQRSLVLDSTATSDIKGTVGVADGGTVTLGANRVILGAADDSVSGLHVSDDLLSSFGNLSGVTLNSYKNVDIYGEVSLGHADLNLTVNAAGIAGHMAANEAATLTAKDFTLKNTLNAGYESTSAAAGSSLTVHADNIRMAGGTAATATTIGGFEQVKLNASKEVVFSGKGSTNINAADTQISSRRITGASGADYTLKASGSMATSQATNTTAALAAVSGLGAKVTLAAADLTLASKVELPSGKFTAQATSGNLTLNDGAEIRAGSVPVGFDKYVEYTPAGTVVLQADAGNVHVAEDASVNVDGLADADAGKIRISAVAGTATIEGDLSGKAGSEGGESGSAELDVKTLADFGAINGKLSDGGFAKSREMRVRTGNVTVAEDDTVRAERVVISADAGTLTVNGAIDASAAQGGTMGLYGGTGVTVTGTASLTAKGTEDGAHGGLVEIATTTGYLDLQPGSEIDVSGGQGGEGGEVRLRAPRTSDNKDIKITAVASSVTGANAIRAEGFKDYTDSSITSSDFATTGTWYKDAEAFMKSALTGATFGLNRLGKAGNPIFTIVPGLEIRNASGDVALANDWSLQNWRFDADTGVGVTATSNLNSGMDGDGHALLAGVLTLRASGNLNLNNSLNDGFSVPAGSFNLSTASAQEGGSSWSYNLIGGADFAAANLMATKSAGNVNMPLTSTATAPEGVRTGTGDIRIAAGGNLDMKNENTVVYTAGHQDEAWGGFAKSSSYLTDGGDIDIRVTGDILGKLPSSGNTQLINHWLYRQGGGTANKLVSWWVKPDLFRQGVAAFGGGDIAVTAGGGISNFSVSVPTTARYDSDGNARVLGGGDLDMQAAGDITSGVYYAGQGEMTIASGGEIKADATSFGTTLALQNASAKVTAVGNVNIETVFNPTMWAQMNANAISTLDGTGANASYLTYGQNSAVSLGSLSGDVTLGSADVSKITADLVSSGNIGARNNDAAKEGLSIMPGTVEATAYDGSIKVGRAILAPAAEGNLKLLAAEDIAARSTTSLIVVSDADVNQLASVTKPQNLTELATTVSQIKASHAATPVHLNDETEIALVARDGSIIGPSALKALSLTSAKAAYISAGTDISLNAAIQQLRSRDMTVIKAGRNLTMPADAASQIRVAGPGKVLVQAGRHISLGTSQGIVTVANTDNANLPATGASLSVLAGLGAEGANVDGYVATYINPTGTPPGTVGDLAAYRGATAQAVAAYMRTLTDDESLSETDAMTQYLALDADRQAVFAYRHFSSELLASGKGFATSGNHLRGDIAIATLFPDSRSYDGDLSLYNSQIRTFKDGSIDILAPGGMVNVGVPTSNSEKEIGIVTEKGGDIRVFADSGFQVEQSKVITQYGSDITVWVNNGDIDAGRGSKTALSIPKRVVNTDKDGNTTIEVKGAAAGSGIRAQTYDPDGPNGDQQKPALGSVALIAPRGVLNASEAGIAAGDFLAVATQVIGADNIQVAGASSGIPMTDSSALGGALAGVSNVASEATKSASDEVARQVAQAAPQQFEPQQLMPAFVSVEVIGLGD